MLFYKKVEPRTGQPLWGTLNNIVCAVWIWPDSAWYLHLNFQFEWYVFYLLYVQQRQFVSTHWIHLSPFEQCDSDWVSEVIFSRFSYCDRQRCRQWLPGPICRSQSRPIISVFLTVKCHISSISTISIFRLSFGIFARTYSLILFPNCLIQLSTVTLLTPNMRPVPRNPLPSKYNWSANSFLSNLYPCWYDWV